LAFLHSFAVIGVIVGYVSGAVIVTYMKGIVTWSFAFQLQGWFMVVIGIFFFFTDNSSLDIVMLI